jgi:aminoglycoside 3-N-acetyltransferase
LDAAELAHAFADAGIERGDSILVHSSLSSLGWVEGGAEAVGEALVTVVGPDGTVLFPTLTGSPEDSSAKPPVFDARHSPCWTGAIPEAARVRPDAIRSLHPTHSVVAIGKLARWFASGHELVRTPCGFGSPYDKLADVGGKIVLVGVTQSVNTSFHMAEEIAGVPYVLIDEPMDIMLTDAGGEPVEMRGTRLHLHGVRRDYDSLESQMIRLGMCHIRRVGDAEVRIVDAMLQRTFLVSKLLEDPLAVLGLTQRAKWQRKP